MSEFILPTSADLKEVSQALLPRLTQDDPFFDSFPIVEEDTDVLMWEQMTRFAGLQQARGLGAEFPSVQPPRIRRFTMRPGVYGEFVPIDEVQLTRRRRQGTFGTPASIDDLVGPAQQLALQRRLDRIRWIGWTTLTTGTFSVTGPTGAIVHTDSYDTQDVTAAVAWSNLTSSTPLHDMRQAQILSRGYSIDFGSRAKAFMNRSTFNYLMGNRNNNDFWGRRLQYGQTVNSLDAINTVLMGEDLPQLVIYDLTYLNEADADEDKTPQLLIPTGKVVILGVRPGGEKLGDYAMTKNANNPGMAPGAFMAVVDSADYGRYPRTLEVMDGHNGGFRVYHPYGIVVVNAA